MSSLERVVIELQDVNHYQQLHLDTENTQNEILKDIQTCLLGIKQGVLDLVEQGEDRDRIASREATGASDVSTTTDGTDPNASTRTTNDGDKIGGNLGTVLGGIGLGLAAAIPAIVAGFAFEITKAFTQIAKMIGRTAFFQRIIEPFKTATKMVGDNAAKLRNAVTGLFSSAIRVFTDAGKSIAGFAVRITKAVDNFFAPIVRVLRSVTSFLISSEGFKQMGESIAKLKSIKPPKLGFIDTLMDTIKGSIKAVTKITGPIIKFFFGFGRVLGRLFAPIGLVMSVFDSLMGAIDGFKDSQAMDAGFFQSIFQTLGGAVIGLVKGLILMPLDLLKNLTSWALEKLGLEKLSAMMDSFSFEDSIGGLLEQLLDFLVYTIPNYLKGKVADILDFVGMDETANNMRADIAKQDETRKAFRDSEDAAEEAVKMGLIEEGGMFSDDTLDQTKLKEATPRQLQAVLTFHSKDLSEEDVKIIESEIASRATGSTTSQTSSTTNQSSTSRSSTTNQSSTSTSTSSTSTSGQRSNTSNNIVYDVKDAVTGDLIATLLTPEAATKVAMDTGGYITSRTAQPSKVGVGTAQTALNPMSTGQVDLPPVPDLVAEAFGANTMGSMRNNLTNEQTRLEETRSKENSNSSSVAMVNAPSSSSTTVNNSNFSGGTMSPTDNTDRTYGNYKR